MIDIDYLVEIGAFVPHNDGNDITVLLRSVYETTMSLVGRSGDVNMILVDNGMIRELNKTLRQLDAPTDVLSFPCSSDGSMEDVSDGFLGDIAISLERAVAQAEELGHSVTRELAFLTVHGLLHLLGYDHITEATECEMFQMQDDVLNFLKLFR